MTNKKRILVVDDEPDMTLMVRLNLQKTGRFEVREENEANNALRSARDFKPDLILLDVMMPDMDGGDVLVQLKDDPNLKKVPVIFITATVLKEEVRSKGGTIGGHPFIPKPFRVETLVKSIDDSLNQAAAPARAK
jgi:CheY-like chemotaxis protein